MYVTAHNYISKMLPKMKHEYLHLYVENDKK